MTAFMLRDVLRSPETVTRIDAHAPMQQNEKAQRHLACFEDQFAGLERHRLGEASQASNLRSRKTVEHLVLTIFQRRIGNIEFRRRRGVGRKIRGAHTFYLIYHVKLMTAWG